MGKFYVKLFVIALCVAFCIFFGVDLATKGVERINGPSDSHPATAKASATGQPAKNGGAAGQSTAAAQGAAGKGEAAKPVSAASAGKAQDAAKSKPSEPVREPAADDTGINRISNKAGELLHIIAFHGIRFIVSMLDAITG